MSAQGRIWTARYANRSIAGSGLAPVRITLGYPRFRLGYEITATVRELAPTGAMLELAEDEFSQRYRDHLDAIGVVAIRRLLDDVRARTGADPVLLCFEMVSGPAAQPCHRRDFAAWWQERTGEQVDELPEAPTGRFGSARRLPIDTGHELAQGQPAPRGDPLGGDEADVPLAPLDPMVTSRPVSASRPPWWRRRRTIAIGAIALLALGAIGSLGDASRPTSTPAPAGASAIVPADATPGPAVTAVATGLPVSPAGATVTPDISLAADAEFRQHLETIVSQFSGDLSVWAQDSSDPASARSEGAWFLADAQAELAYLAAHPAAPCYSGAWDLWHRVVGAVRDLFRAAASGKPTTSLLEAATQTATGFENAGVNTSC